MSSDSHRIARTIAVVMCVSLSVACTRGLVTPQYGLQEGRLGSCVGLRGCVSSQSEHPDHFIEPLRYTNMRYEARNDLITVLRTFSDAKVVSAHRSYLRVEFPSMASRTEEGEPVIGSSTIDDTEFFFPVNERVIHVRSMPRRNMPDAGENRNRIELIRERLAALQSRRAGE